MLLQTSKRLRKFFDSGLTNEKIWQEIVEEGSLKHIHQLTALSGDAARALVKNEKRLELLSIGLTELPAEVAQELAQYKGDKLFLNCVRSLAPESARAISHFKGSKLALNGIKSIDLTQLGRLSVFKGRLILDGAESIDVTQKDGKRAETVFGSLQFGALTMTRLKKIPAFLFRALSRFRGQLKLNGITQLTGNDADILSGFLGSALSLKGIGVITPEMATLLERYDGFLDLSGASEIDDQLLSAAASRKEGFSLFSSTVKKNVLQYKNEKAREDRLQNEKKWRQIRRDEETRRKEEILLAELEAFDVPVPAQGEPEPVETGSPVAAFEIVVPIEDDRFEEEIGQDILDDIEINLNLKVNQKRRRMDELLAKDSSNRSGEETAELRSLEREIEELNEKIKGTLEILVERKELGAVVFNTSSDLAAYLLEAGAEEDENDVLANIEEADLFSKSF